MWIYELYWSVLPASLLPFQKTGKEGKRMEKRCCSWCLWSTSLHYVLSLFTAAPAFWKSGEKGTWGTATDCGRKSEKIMKALTALAHVPKQPSSLEIFISRHFAKIDKTHRAFGRGLKSPHLLYWHFLESHGTPRNHLGHISVPRHSNWKSLILPQGTPEEDAGFRLGETSRMD